MFRCSHASFPVFYEPSPSPVIKTRKLPGKCGQSIEVTYHPETSKLEVRSFQDFNQRRINLSCTDRFWMPLQPAAMAIQTLNTLAPTRQYEQSCNHPFAETALDVIQTELLISE